MPQEVDILRHVDHKQRQIVGDERDDGGEQEEIDGDDRAQEPGDVPTEERPEADRERGGCRGVAPSRWEIRSAVIG
jgi:hypothetical protein